jgi:ElaB/YqjD/DUF883 family membrane-anchored ribosome-binding protein
MNSFAPRAVTRDGSGAGASALHDVNATLEEAVATVSNKGHEAIQNVREVRDTFADALLASVRAHPYTTLALIGSIGFVFGATWRR